MKTDNKQKVAYFTPEIKVVTLDNEISLVLESTPPIGPGEAYYDPEFFEEEPFYFVE